MDCNVMKPLPEFSQIATCKVLESFVSFCNDKHLSVVF